MLFSRVRPAVEHEFRGCQMVNRKHRIYGTLAIFCPLAIVGAVLVFQTIAYPGITSTSDPPDDADVHAAVFMALFELVQIFVATAVGCLLGLILAIRTLKLQKRWVGVGLVGVIFNSIPLLFLAVTWIRDTIRTW